MIVKVLKRMRKIEDELAHVCGSVEKQKKLLAPFMVTLKPMLALAGVSTKDILLEMEEVNVGPSAVELSAADESIMS